MRRSFACSNGNELFKQVVAVNKKHLYPDHPDTLLSMNNLASVYNA
jgi:hypothetical protein